MPAIRRNGGLGRLEPREGTGNVVPPESTIGGRGTQTPLGTRQRAHETEGQRFEPIRNGLAFVAYDPSPEARAARAVSFAYGHARRALERAEGRFGPRPQTIRGLPKAG